MPKFQIEIHGLKVFAHHGVLGFEKALGQEFVIDAFVEVEAGLNDDIDESVSYATIAELVVGNAKQNPVNLLETLAYRLHSVVMDLSPRVVMASITVHKPNAPIDTEFKDVTVSYTGGRD